jgi:transcription-repair coupling factor (superfamily II helicase)
MEYPQLRLAVLTDAQLLRVREGRTASRKKLPENQQKLTSYTDLAVGDLVVHEHHGIGRFSGIVKMTVDGFEKDYMKISYAGTDCLYVPCTQLDLVSKYIGAGGEDKPVKLSKMGGTEWARSRSRAKAAAKDLAKGCCSSTPSGRGSPATPFPRIPSGSGNSRRTSSTPRPTISCAA